jgi:hypothetical protein
MSFAIARTGYIASYFKVKAGYQYACIYLFIYLFIHMIYSTVQQALQFRSAVLHKKFLFFKISIDRLFQLY